MVRKGQTAYFGVKFLKGYGFSVKVKDNKLVLKNTYNPFESNETEEWFCNKMPYEKIVLCGKGYVSTEALSLLSKNNKNLILLIHTGKRGLEDLNLLCKVCNQLDHLERVYGPSGLRVVWDKQVTKYPLLESQKLLVSKR